MNRFDLINELRADELPTDGQAKREARMMLGKLLDRAADEIEWQDQALKEALDACVKLSERVDQLKGALLEIYHINEAYGSAPTKLTISQTVLLNVSEKKDD